jgi:hypothetical protein
VNGIGTREGIYVATFASAGVTRDAAFAASLVVVAASVVASLPGVLEFVYRLGGRQRNAPTTTLARPDAVGSSTDV